MLISILNISKDADTKLFVTKNVNKQITQIYQLGWKTLQVCILQL